MHYELSEFPVCSDVDACGVAVHMVVVPTWDICCECLTRVGCLAVFAIPMVLQPMFLMVVVVEVADRLMLRNLVGYRIVQWESLNR